MRDSFIQVSRHQIGSTPEFQFSFGHVGMGKSIQWRRGFAVPTLESAIGYLGRLTRNLVERSMFLDGLHNTESFLVPASEEECEALLNSSREDESARNLADFQTGTFRPEIRTEKNR